MDDKNIISPSLSAIKPKDLEYFGNTTIDKHSETIQSLSMVEPNNLSNLANITNDPVLQELVNDEQKTYNEDELRAMPLKELIAVMQHQK